MQPLLSPRSLLSSPPCSPSLPFILCACARDVRVCACERECAHAAGGFAVLCRRVFPECGLREILWLRTNGTHTRPFSLSHTHTCTSTFFCTSSVPLQTHASSFTSTEGLMQYRFAGPVFFFFLFFVLSFQINILGNLGHSSEVEQRDKQTGSLAHGGEAQFKLTSVTFPGGRPL